MEERQVSKLSVFRSLRLSTLPVISVTTWLFSGPALNFLKNHVIGKGSTILTFVHPSIRLMFNKLFLSIYYIPSQML